ncbi:MAG: PDZ domain-containing protein, partial [Bacteriodetes bacterium]|nr:PDZ domain-containing protein [Bacteroidota bacterium]
MFIGEDVPSGLYIVTVERNSPAELANVRPGDRLIAVNGQLVESMKPNPREIIAQEANKSETLSLRLQSTD